MADNPSLQDPNHSEQQQRPQTEVNSQLVSGASSQPLNGQAESSSSGSGAVPNGTSSTDASGQPSSSQSAAPPVASASTQPEQPLANTKMDATEGSSAREAEKDRASTKLAHTTSTAATGTDAGQLKGKKSKRAKAKKKSGGPSLISKLLHTLVPCFGPPPRAHVPDIEPVEKPRPSQPQTQPEPAVASSPVAAPPSSDVQEKPPTPTVTESKEEQSTPAEEKQTAREIPIPPPLQPVDVPPPSDDPAVVVPPTPTKTLPPEETAGLTSGAVQPPGSTGSSKRDSLHEAGRQGDSENESDASTSFTDEEEGDVPPMEDPEDEEERLIANGGAGIPIGPDGVPRPLLPPLSAKQAGRKCLVLDLDETLVHSSFKSIQQADYVVPVEIEYHWHNVYVIKRPGVDNFLKKMGEIYEIVVFTASLSKYADPVLDKLDIHRVVSHRLFRESCYNHRGNYVKDLSQLGRPISDTIIIDNSPASYIFHPNNAVPVSSWFNDPHDTELTDLVPFLTDLAQVDDVRGVLDGGL